MTSTKHSPGPWHVEPYQWDQGASIAICNKQHGVLAVIQPLNEAEDEASAQRDECDYPNACLMAAAPELLGALQWLVDDLTDAEEDRNPETGDEYDSVTNARAVIAKVKGGAQ